MSHLSTLSLPSSGARYADPSFQRDVLQRHMRQCMRANGFWHSVRCTAERTHSFMGHRFVSTIVVASGLLALSAYW